MLNDSGPKAKPLNDRGPKTKPSGTADNISSHELYDVLMFVLSFNNIGSCILTLILIN